MGNFVPLLVIGGLLLAMVYFSNRAKAKRAAADTERRQAMVPGTRVMTTSGLHGTLVAVDPDNDGSQADTVTLEVAPGVEVTWALIALREAPVRVVLDADDRTVGPDDAAAEALDADASPVATGTPVRMVKPKGRAADH